MFSWNCISMFMPIKRFSVLFLLLMFAQQVEAKDLCLGTFSSLHFNTEGGDLLGVEIKIVHTESGKEAAIQFSEGEPGALIMAPIVCNGSHVSFKLPRDASRPAATFEGNVSKVRLIGEFVFESGAHDKVVLPRRKSYWD